MRSHRYDIYGLATRTLIGLNVHRKHRAVIDQLYLNDSASMRGFCNSLVKLCDKREFSRSRGILIDCEIENASGTREIREVVRADAVVVVVA